MAKKKIDEIMTPTDKNNPSVVARDDDLYKKQIKAKAAPKPKVGMDVDKEFYDALITAAQKNDLDIGKLESFTQISQNRNQVYQLIDTMCQDSTIAAVLETYAEDATETNQDGRIIWAVSDDENVAKYVTYLMDTMNIDKHSYKWVYSLIKYGDLYLRLFRESEYNDKLFDTDDEKEKEKHNQSKSLNESLAKIMEQSILDETLNGPEISLEESMRLDDLNDVKGNPNASNIVNEDIKFNVFSQNDRYVHYMEMVPNPAEVYELTRLGKSYAYIKAPVNVNLNKTNDVLDYALRYNYAFRKKDVNIFEATEFVHAALEDNSSRTPEEVSIFLSDNDYENNSNALTYTVRRGQSLLYSTYKIWRELMLLEYSLLLNRVTKSSIIRVIGVEVGDMPKEQIGPHLAGIKQLIEQKSALDMGNGMSEYTNPGPIENNIYVPTHNNVGNISAQQIGGDVNVTGLEDLDYFKNKFYGSLKVPKQYFGDTDDSAGFDGGTSLSLISSRYAKTVKRIQNTFIQAITDAINLMLIDKGLSSYVNRFELHMVAPTTREEVERQDSISSKIQLASDVMNLVTAEVKDIKLRLEILKLMLNQSIGDVEVNKLIQKEIDKYEEYERKGILVDENGDVVEGQDSTGLTGSIGGGGDLGGGGDFGGGDMGGDLGGGDMGGDAGGDAGGGEDLPSPADLGVDFTDSDSM